MQRGAAQAIGVDHEADHRGARIGGELQLVGLQGMHREQVAVGLVALGRAGPTKARGTEVGAPLHGACRRGRVAVAQVLQPPSSHKRAHATLALSTG